MMPTSKLYWTLAVIAAIGTILLILVSSPPFTSKADSFIPKHRPLSYQSQCGVA